MYTGGYFFPGHSVYVKCAFIHIIKMGDQLDELYDFPGSVPYLYLHLQVHQVFVPANKI